MLIRKHKTPTWLAPLLQHHYRTPKLVAALGPYLSDNWGSIETNIHGTWFFFEPCKVPGVKSVARAFFTRLGLDYRVPGNRLYVAAPRQLQGLAFTSAMRAMRPVIEFHLLPPTAPAPTLNSVCAPNRSDTAGL